MFNCFRQKFDVPRRVLFSQRTSVSKYYSAFSPNYCKLKNNTVINKPTSQKINLPKQIRLRYFSLQSIQTFYDSVSSSEASQVVKHILLNIHELGLSWSVTIIAASAVLKLFISFPCAIYQQYLVSKLELTKVELDGIVKSLRDKIISEAYRKKWNEAKLQFEFRKKIREHWKSLVIKNNCHPFKITILFFIQFPFWLITTLTIRKFAEDVRTGQCDSLESALQFQVGGPFWSKNLAMPDPIYILPTINFLSLLACTELSLSFQTHKRIAKNFASFFLNKIYPNVLRLFAVAFFFVSASSSSALSLFWAVNTSIALIQSLMIKFPKVRRFLKIPKTSSEVDKPYREIWNRLSEKYSKFIIKKK